MGASGWIERVSWREDLASALAEARALAYARVPAAEQAAVAAMTAEALVARLDLDPDDVPRWVSWVAAQGPETRFALYRPTGSVLDVDHVEALAPLSLLPDGTIPPTLRLLAPEPSLCALRPATPIELARWFETDRPALSGPDDAEHVLGDLQRNDAVAIPSFGAAGPVELFLVGVTGD